MSSTGSIAGHPVVTGLRTAAGALDPGALGLGWQLGDDEVETALATALELESRAAAYRGMLLREAECRNLRERTQASTVQRWLGDRFRLSRGEAAAQVRAAQALGRHRVLGEALGCGAASAGQVEVIAQVLDTVAVLPGVPQAEQEAAGRFLVEQCATLIPAELGRAGRALVEALTVAPSVDDPADAAALDREAARAEAAAQDGERNVLTVTRRGGKPVAVLEPGSIGQGILARYLREKADRRHPGTDGFEDTRPLGERRGDALIDLLADTVGMPKPRTTPSTGTGPDARDEPAEVADEPDGQGVLIGGTDRPSRRPVSAVLTVTSTVEGLRSGLAGAG